MGDSRSEVSEVSEVVNEPIDPDTGPAPPARRHPWRGQGPVVGVVAVGGALGATARYGASLLWPTPSAAFPWTTLLVNAVGCAIIGVFLVLISEVWTAHRLVRPFFGTGVLGGFTTFSTYAVDCARLVQDDRIAIAFAYLAGTLVAAMAAVWAAVAATRRALGAYDGGPAGRGVR
ncbi:fluoride efflux transporter CrcB [Streptomyces malaysiensis]|uniref:Fluoride-specific ion channel FluC n=1 Tax=Streptomyces malaysiensis subsp. samsunensis TaxID=459658 RepID=A0A9X2RRM8_STRMQ|nr:fluoride efflux transporter CrcB [Streptomyces samsunensis]MCQ8827728.1 fluoride efflux transporter CrcB [Streptomyces samsunensis]